MCSNSGKCFGFWDLFLDSEKCFWILGSGHVLDSGTRFWVLGSVLDSGKCFWILGMFLGFGTCFWILGSVLDLGRVLSLRATVLKVSKAIATGLYRDEGKHTCS